MSNSVWDEFEKPESTEGPKEAAKKFNRIDFKSEATQIRLLSDEGVKRDYHFVKIGTTGKPVICCGASCPVCQRGELPQPKWLFKALDRETLNVGVVQMSKTIMKGIHKLKKLPMYGPDVKLYDLIIMKDITVGKDREKKTTYSVSGLPKGTVPKLDPEVNARVREELEAIDLEQVAVPYSPEQTLKYLGWPALPTATASVNTVPAVVVVPQSAAPAPASTDVDITKFLKKKETQADEAYSGPAEGELEELLLDG
jgi:hypothetical protein